MKRPPKPLAILLTLMLLLGVITPVGLAVTGDRYLYDQPGDKNYVCNTNVLERYSPTGGNNQSYKVTAPRAQGNATFISEPIVVDGIREAAWDAATAYPIANKFNTDMTAAAPSATAEGTLRLLWDGPVLYLLVEVTGDSTKSDTGTPTWNTASYTPNTDGVFVFMDVFNDQWGMETDTQGVFFLGANPALTSVTSYNNSTIPSLGSFFNANNQDYSTRLKSFKSSGYNAGDGVNYTYEVALQIEGWGDEWNRELKNGTKVGLEVAIFDEGNSFAYWSKTQYYAGREGNSNLPNSERVRNRDWGEVTLSGWDGVTPFAYSGWRADEAIRFWNSKSNPGGSGNGTGASDNGDGSLVWTAESKARMIAAKSAYNSLKDSPDATRAEKEAAVLEVCQAFAGLRWGDTKYPDPHDLPVLNTLPNVWEFFDKTKGTNGMVTNEAEWKERKQEILALAQFYEYGYKPRLGVDYNISIITNNYAGTGNPSVTAQVTPTNVNYSGGTAQNVTVNVTLPTAGLPAGQKAAISIGGSWTTNGIANIAWPTWGLDNRTDTYAWGTRTGTFYLLFPYARNSTSADSSVTIAQATAVSVYLDILQMAVAQNPALDAKIDPSKAITKGFSYRGKYAFVAGVFDERVKAIVAGGAGATGPANWRYNAQGQEYNFAGTPYYNPGAESIVAHGTEGPGNSYRHNRVRETELFRHFLPYGHMYKHEEGSYAYGEFGRLPFDQALLVATLAPDRAIIIDTNLNDYNDGAVTDNMSLQIAKAVYRNLGVNGDDFVKFNNGNYVSSGDPHGSASATVEGKYLSDLLYGTHLLTDAEAEQLNTDPYSLNVCNGQTQSPYDYYWGGYNTITGGQDGIDGTDGWYYYNDIALVESAVDAIRGGTYLIPYIERTNQATKNAWVQTAVDALIPAGNGATATVSYESGAYTISVRKGLVARTVVITVTEELSPVSVEDLLVIPLQQTICASWNAALDIGFVNSTLAPLTDVQLVVTVPVSTTVVYPNSTTGLVDGPGAGQVMWQVGTLGAGQTVTRRIELRFDSGVPNATLVQVPVTAYFAEGDPVTRTAEVEARTDDICLITPTPTATPSAAPTGTTTATPTVTPTATPTMLAPLCTRADVAAVIYGAWEGTPVEAWVGGTKQPTLYTARDAFGRQAVLWTFYPPASTNWTVVVQPQLPAGIESPRWQYRLLWIEPAPPGFQPGQAAGGAVTVSRCSGTVLHFQLVDTGAQ